MMAGETPTPQGLLYDFFVDEAARLGQRTDWFLIFHAILFEAFFSVPNASLQPAAAEISQMIVAVIGCLTSYLWFMTGFRQRWLSRHLGECMVQERLMGGDVARLFAAIFEMRRKGLPKVIGWAQPVPTFAVVIPFAFTAAWFALLVVPSRQRWVSAAAGAASLLVATLWIVWLRHGPVICQQFVEPLNRFIENQRKD